MAESAWLIPILPLIGYVFLLVLGNKASEGLVAGASVLLTGVSFLLSVRLFFGMGLTSASNQTYLFHWLSLSTQTLSIGFSVTHLNALMLLIVTTVSTLVLLFSKGYMHGDERFSVFYQYLNLFIFSMLALVISPNLLQLYIFWEMVGLCSYLLVGFWFFKPEAALAAKKSFIVTRIGDVGLFAGIVLLFLATKSFDDSSIFAAASAGTLSLTWITTPHLITLSAILIFVGAVGKSAQFPLHVWLPDAMEGPTPVSALIHAATMVAAGVYLVARTYPLFALSHAALTTVSWIGGGTALFAALIALTQRDIKRVIAYSTMSQLGYMMMALGVGGYSLGMFHLMTHAFFKALLFLAAGSIIHALDTQDLFQMGGLGKKMPLTKWTFLVGALALSGIVPFAGFWSKDDLLAYALNHGHGVLYAMGLFTAFLTAFYIFRVFFLVFTGETRDEAKLSHAHEGGLSMRLPLVVLAIFATVAGFINTPFNGEWLERYLAVDFTPQTPGYALAQPDPHTSVGLMAISVAVGLLGILFAGMMYGRRAVVDSGVPANWYGRLSYRKFYIDEIYESTLVRGGKVLAQFVEGINRYVISLLVSGVSWLVYLFGVGLKFTQTGQVQTYGVVALCGLVVLIIIAYFHQGGVL